MKFDERREVLINTIETIQQFHQNGKSLRNCTLRGIDFSKEDIDWSEWDLENTTFLGCELPIEDEITLRRRGASIYPAPEDLPYDPFRTNLYSWRELMEGFSQKDDQSADWKIYQHFARTRFNPSVNEALWQRIHDHAIDEALRSLLKFDSRGMSQLRCVGFMGGHSVGRDDPFFKRAAETARLLTQNNYFMVSGGGPGIMEAVNFGAYFAGHEEEDFYLALSLLQKAPHYKDEHYYAQARKVMNEFPEGSSSLAVPTWFYGHEPSNLFAAHIAKYFSNSIREDTLLAISLYGIVFAPGSAGTTQEIFMDATQNHYGTFNYYSPMVFLGKKRYEVDTMIYPLLRQLAWGRKYYDLLHITDEPAGVLDFLEQHPPVQVVE